MKIEIELPENVIIDAAKQAWKSSFRPPEYATKVGGEGFEVVKVEVQKHLSTVASVEEIRDAIRKTANNLAPAIIREAVTEELRKLARRIVKEEKDSQTLL